MKSFRLWPVGALTLLAVASLQADTLPVDPLIKYTTADPTPTEIVCTVSGCTTPLSPPIGDNGFATLSIQNETGMDIIALTFLVPTTNFDQLFVATADAFTEALILPDEAHDLLQVEFFGTGTGTAGAFTLGADPSAPGSGAMGFVPGGVVNAQVFFGTPQPGDFQGLLNGETATLALTTPEPSMIWLSLFGVIGLLVARRKLRKA
jgi:hypothetical protein